MFLGPGYTRVHGRAPGWKRAREREMQINQYKSIESGGINEKRTILIKSFNSKSARERERARLSSAAIFY
jgi:hypothetical protein